MMMNATKRYRLLVGVSTLIIIFSATAKLRANDPKDILVIANKKVPMDSVSLEELKILFLKQRKSIGGQKIVPIHSPDGTGIRPQFNDKVLGMLVSDESSYWKEERIRRGVAPPIELVKTLKAVFYIKGSISYIYRSEYKKGVAKILLVLPR